MRKTQADDMLSGTRVLVVDDERAVRSFVKAGLEALGCLVDTAEDGRKALELLLESEFDIVIVDIRMERMDGFAFLVEALRIRPWLGVVIITGYVDNATVNQAKELNITAVLPKPIDLDLLRQRVLEESRKKKHRVEMPAAVSLERFQYELEILRRLTRSAIESETLDDALRTLSVGFGGILSTTAVAILSVEERPVIVLHLRQTVSEKFLASIENNIRLRYRALSGRQLPDNMRAEINGVPCNDKGPETVGRCETVPIINAGEISGLITLASITDDAHSETDMTFLYHAANHVTAVLVAFRRMKHLAIRDCVTNLYSRRYLLHQLDYLEALSKRLKLPLGFALLNIEGFAKITKQYGARVGEEILGELGGLLASSSRAADVAGKYEDQQVLVLLPGTDAAGAETFAQRIVDTVATHPFKAAGHEIKLTISAAAMGFDDPLKAPSQDEILAGLDESVREAGARGGKHVVVAGQNPGKQHVRSVK